MTDKEWATIKYFKKAEFLCGTSKTEDMKIDFLKLLDRCRVYAGVPFIVTSGYRSPEHNTKIGGAKNSPHLRGYACDISCPTSAIRFKILSAAIEVGFKRIGVGKNFIHLDNDPSLAQQVCWMYP
jgi:zinc D-Ala-D-Ala carboxypeptidase